MNLYFKVSQLNGSIWIQTGIGVAIVLKYKQDSKQQCRSCLQKDRIRKQEMTMQKKKKSVFVCFFLQSKNESGGGDVLSAIKPKTFEVAKKNVLGRGGQVGTACTAWKKTFFSFFNKWYWSPAKNCI